LLQGMELAARLQSFDGHDGLAGEGADLDEARARGLPFEEHRAGAALALAAPVFGPGQVQVLTQHGQERSLWIGIETAPRAVDDEVDDGHQVPAICMKVVRIPTISSRALRR